jgi:hypothetical protein
MGDIRFEQEYHFPVSLVLHGVTFHRNGKQEVSEVRYFVNGQRAWLATKAEQTGQRKNANAALAVYDFDNSTMLLLSPSKKTGMAMDLSAQCSTPGAPCNKQGEANWKCHKTGQRKIILQLRCDECICIDDVRNLKGELWVTRDLHTDLAPVGIRTAYASQLRAAQRSGGVLVEGKFYEGGVMKSSLQMRDLNRSANMVVSLAGYKLR